MKQIEILGVFMWICVHHSHGVGGVDGCKLDFFSRCFGMEFQMINDPETVRNICDPQILLKAMVCMDKMKETCEAELRHKIESSGWTEAMRLYCQKKELIAANIHCMETAGTDTKSCDSSLFTSFRQKMISRNITMSDPRIIMQLTCEHKQDKSECFKMKMAKTCPTDVRDILGHVSLLLTKAPCTFGRYVVTTPTESSLKDTVEQPQNQGCKSGVTTSMVLGFLCVIYVL